MSRIGISASRYGSASFLHRGFAHIRKGLSPKMPPYSHSERGGVPWREILV